MRARWVTDVEWHKSPAYLTIIRRARMGSESIAPEAESQMGYWLRGHEGERNNCFNPFLPPKSPRFSLLVG